MEPRGSALARSVPREIDDFRTPKADLSTVFNTEDIVATRLGGNEIRQRESQAEDGSQATHVRVRSYQNNRLRNALCLCQNYFRVDLITARMESHEEIRVHRRVH